MYKTINIGSINRSGGSLLARLFDGHPKILSYPLELAFPVDNNYYPFFESYTGVPEAVPYFNPSENQDIDTLLNLPKQKSKIVLKWGKEESDAIGVRKNYLEKVFYGKVKTNFDYEKFRAELEKRAKNAKNIQELWNIRHDTYFDAWDNGKYKDNPEYVVMQSSSGLYMSNIDEYFREFRGSFFIHPIRDIMCYVASEKTRLARRFYGSRRFSYPKFPNFLVKKFSHYDLNAIIRAWMVAITRVVLLQEKYGVNGKFIVYGNENLLHNTKETMDYFCKKMGFEFHPILLEPTIALQPWKGNSHQGAREGVSKDLATYYIKVLMPDEINKINKIAGKVRNYLLSLKTTPLDMTKIPKEYLYDYEYQEKYFDNKEKLVLYYGVINSGTRKVMVKSQNITSVMAFLYSKMIQIIHVPRMLKLRFLPGLGKQNYT